MRVRFPPGALNYITKHANMVSYAAMPKAPKPKRPNKPASKPGPKPEVLKLEGDWIDNIRKSFQKKKPAGGWPK